MNIGLTARREQGLLSLLGGMKQMLVIDMNGLKPALKVLGLQSKNFHSLFRLQHSVIHFGCFEVGLFTLMHSYQYPRPVMKL
jgi:hypothetical protein